VLPLALNGPQVSVALASADSHLVSVSVRSCGFMRLRGAFAGPETRIQLGPDPGLALDFERDREVDAAAIYASLTGTSSDWATGIMVMPEEVWGGLCLWLAISEPSLCGLSAEGAPAENGIVPYFFGFTRPVVARFTSGLLDKASLCVLMHPHGLPPATAEPDSPEAFELCVRSFGAEDTLARRLIEQVAAWDAAGRPATQGLSIRAYRSESDYVSLANEVVLPKRSTKLVLSWE
jgi:protein-L-isoaspartate(D-aspartate) O-methyltransferase